MANISEDRSDIWIGSGLLAFCAFAAWRTLKVKSGFGESLAGPAFVPWLMIGGIAILSLLLILRGLRRAGLGRDSEISLPNGRTALAMAGFALLLVAYSAAFFPLGYIPATLVAFVVGLFLVGERRILVLVLFPLVMTFAVYYGFTEFLKVWLP